MSPHRQKSTTLIYCEGAHDLTFVRYLVSLYNQGRLSYKSTSAKQGSGGSADGLVIEAIKRPGIYDRRLVKADRDRDSDEINNAERLAADNNIVIIWSTPCLEAILLNVLENRDYSRRSSNTCKSRFERIYIPRGRRTDRDEYSRLFSLDVLEEVRVRLPELDLLINLICE